MVAGVAMAAAAVVLAGRRATLGLGARDGSQRARARSFGREKVVMQDKDLEAKLDDWREEMGVPASDATVDGEADAADDVDLSKIKVTLSTKHFDITPALRDHVDERLKHVMGRFGKNILSFDTHLEVLRNPKGKDVKHSAELVAGVRPGYGKKTITVRVKATSPDMYLSVNDMTHQIERKVRQLKEKVTKGMKHSKQSDAGTLLMELPGYDGADSSDLEEAVRTAQTALPMTVDEALESFSVAEDDGSTDAFVFVDKKNQKVSVLYRDDSRSVNLYVPKERTLTQIY
jgi:ribosomal subunit interface protein